MLKILPHPFISVNPLSPFPGSPSFDPGASSSERLAATTEQASCSGVYQLHKSEFSSLSSMFHTVASNNNKNLERQVRVWNGLIEVSEDQSWSSKRRLNLPVKGSKRGVITKRSKKSRVRQLKHFCKLPTPPDMFSTLTWADDVHHGLSQEMKVKWMDCCKQELNIWFWNQLSNLQWEVTWSQEWKKRRMGKYKGEFVPHLHLLWQVQGMEEKDYARFTERLKVKWIEITGTQEYSKAFEVANQKESHQFIGGSRKMIMSYCSKYSVNQESDDGKPGVTIGRTWGHWGSIQESAPESMSLNESDIVKLKRILRRKSPNAKGWFLSSLKIPMAGTMTFVIGSEFIRWVEWLSLNTASMGLPF